MRNIINDIIKPLIIVCLSCFIFCVLAYFVNKHERKTWKPVENPKQYVTRGVWK